jgi:hypothetical protein
MKREPQDRLERWTQNLLEHLPQRPAPSALSLRVLQQIRRQAVRPWHKTPWLEWPLSLRILSALIFFGALALACFTTETAGVGGPDRFQQAAACGNALATLGRALAHAASNFSPIVVPVLVAGFAVAWGMTWGLGAACVRLADSKR